MADVIVNDKTLIMVPKEEEEKIPMSIFYPQVIQLRETIKPFEIAGKDIDTLLLKKIRKKIGNRCIRQGYVDENSIRILSRTIGKINTAHFNGEIYYNIKCEANICLASQGDKVRCKIIGKNKTGIACKLKPLQIIVPASQMEDKSVMERLNKDDEIIVEIIKSRWELDQAWVDVVGRFISKV